MSNTFGQLIRLTTFGESHGPAIGGVLEGVPAGLSIDLDRVDREMSRRRPGQSAIASPRKELDHVEWLSGLFEGVTTGTPIGFLIRNNDQHSADYDHLKEVLRPSHADYTYTSKYGIRDHRGGGRSSARETACRVAAGAIVKQYLETQNIAIHAWVSQVGRISLTQPIALDQLHFAEENEVRCPHPETASEMIAYIESIRSQNDSVGGVISAVITGLPTGIGEPVFDKLQARLAYSMMGINAVKGFEYGAGFEASRSLGSQMNDRFAFEDGKIVTTTNHSGGIQGGISNGMPVDFKVAFKPVATIGKEQETVNLQGERIQLSAKGRHDPCVVPRAVPIVEAMAALVVADMLLLAKAHESLLR